MNTWDRLADLGALLIGLYVGRRIALTRARRSRRDRSDAKHE